MMNYRHFRGASMMEYILGLGLIVGALIVVATVMLPDSLASMFMGTINNKGTDKSNVSAQKLGTQTNPFATLQDFDADKLNDVMSKMQVECAGTSRACFPTYTPGLDETSGGLGQEYLDKLTQQVLAAIKGAATQEDLPEDLRAMFRQMADLGMDLADRQRLLADAIEDGDYVTAQQLINEINGGTETFISTSCMPAAAVCMPGPSGLYYNLVPTDDPSSLLSQISALRGEISGHPNIDSIENAAFAMDSIFEALEQRTESISILAEGNPPLTVRYTETEIQDFVTTLTGNVSYVQSLIATMDRTRAASNNTADLMNSVKDSDNFPESDAAVEASIDTLVDTIATSLLKDKKFTDSLLAGTATPDNASNLALGAFKDVFEVTSDDERRIAQKMRDELISKTDIGTSLVEAALSKALADAASKELLSQLSSTGDDKDLVNAVIEVIEESPSVAQDLKDQATASDVDLTVMESTAEFIAKGITESEAKDEAVISLNNNANTFDNASGISCSTGRGKIKGRSCKG